MNDKFNLIAIHLLPNCAKHIRKVLNDDWYFFSKKYIEKNGELNINESYSVPENFYSDKINIQAIVGKNGSGKSSVVEILLRLINNLAYDLISNAKTSTKLHFVNDLNAEIFYVINGVLNSFKCLDSKVYLDQGNGYIGVGKYLDAEDDLYKNSIGQNVPLEEAIPLLQKLFFTIVNNYSFHAYNPSDFFEEYEDREHIWINGLFHKNDGYLTPLVLNPYRDFGRLNMEIEKQLTNVRLASLFYQFNKEGIDFIDDYKFQNISFALNKDHVNKKYKYVLVRKGRRIGNAKDRIVKAQNSRKDFFNETLRQYFGEILEDKRLEIAYKYLVYKTFSISEKYPDYNNLIKVSQNRFNEYCAIVESKKIQKLIKKIKEDTSHITIKIRQTLKYIDFVSQRIIDNEDTRDENEQIKKIDQDYISYQPTDSLIFKGLSYSDQIITSFPPPFYKVAIVLKTPKNEFITFDKMSSGERQFLFYMSTLLYHLKNLNSVVKGDESVHYKYVNVILEEVELYFHPEYQRQFISKLLKYIEASHFDNLDYISVIIATHSPFILSDIPKDNIMFLDNGKQVNDPDGLPTLGANIHEMLKHSFFLEKGSMGAFAVDKINDTINYLNMQLLEKELKNIKESEGDFKDKLRLLEELRKKVKVRNLKKHKELIDLIDEPILKAKLLEMYDEVANKEDRIEMLERKIEAMQKELKKIKD